MNWLPPRRNPESGEEESGVLGLFLAPHTTQVPTLPSRAQGQRAAFSLHLVMMGCAGAKEGPGSAPAPSELAFPA